MPLLPCLAASPAFPLEPLHSMPPQSPRPSHWSNDAGTSFRNPWPSAQAPTWSEMVAGGGLVGWAKREDKLTEHERSREIKVVEPDWGAGRGASARSGRGDRENGKEAKIVAEQQGKGLLLGTWLGHAGAFVEIPLERGREGQPRSAKLLFDPIFSGTAGPTAYTGPKRYRKSPCEVDDLPGCDCVFISHNHYDHLDLSSIQAVMKRFPNTRYFVPLGNKPWFVSTGVPEHQINEMDWWQDIELCPEELSYEEADEDAQSRSRLRMTCVPAQHNSGRTGIDSGATLWSGWVVEHLVTSQPSKPDDETTGRVTRKGALYFAGDTGYRRHRTSNAICPVFEELGKKFGPFDLSFLPIWRGGSLSFVSWLGLRLHHENIPSALHGSPTDAVAMHLDIKSRNSIGIHFGTFIGAEHESLEAIIELADECEKAGVHLLEDETDDEKGRFGVVDLGETIVIEIDELVIVG